mmetsp:Transcript_24664/g.39092  ORF Transcript_24664/g.39092 Transcript_24664/m.39092 type:complete len:220 (+) Transcript_24664:657-1316(+)
MLLILLAIHHIHLCLLSLHIRFFTRLRQIIYASFLAAVQLSSFVVHSNLRLQLITSFDLPCLLHTLELVLSNTRPVRTSRLYILLSAAFCSVIHTAFSTLVQHSAFIILAKHHIFSIRLFLSHFVAIIFKLIYNVRLSMMLSITTVSIITCTRLILQLLIAVIFPFIFVIRIILALLFVDVFVIHFALLLRFQILFEFGGVLGVIPNVSLLRVSEATKK